MSSNFPGPPPKDDASIPHAVPVHFVPPPPPPRKSGGVVRALLILALMGSVGLNLLMCCGGLFLGNFGSSNDTSGWIREKFHSGNAGAADRKSVV